MMTTITRDKTRKASAWVTALTLTCATAAAASDQVAVDQPVATVGPVTVSADDVREEVVARRRLDLARNRIDALSSGTVDEALRDLIDVRLLAIAAREEGVERRADVARRLALVVDQELARIELANITATPPITDAVLRQYYDTHLDQFRGPSRVHARHIVVRTEDEAIAALRRVRQGSDFVAIARDVNIDSTRAGGGDLGWVGRGAMVRQFDETLFALRAGQVSEVVQTSMGFHIVRVEEIEPGKLAEFSSARDEVRRKVIEARLADTRAALTDKYHVVIHRDVVESLKK